MAKQSGSSQQPKRQRKGRKSTAAVNRKRVSNKQQGNLQQNPQQYSQQVPPQYSQQGQQYGYQTPQQGQQYGYQTPQQGQYGYQTPQQGQQYGYQATQQQVPQQGQPYGYQMPQQQVPQQGGQYGYQTPQYGYQTPQQTAQQGQQAGTAVSGQNAEDAGRQAAQTTQHGLFVQQASPRVQRSYRLTKEQRAARKRRASELRRRKKYRRLLTTLIFLLLLIGAFVLIRTFTGNSELVPEDELDMADLEDDDEEENYDGPPIATILFAGDISTSADQLADVLRTDNTYDFTAVFSGVSSYIENADYAVADFETTMVDNLSYGTEPYYNAPIQLAGALRTIGFRLMSTANTHMLDNGINGVNSTIDYLTAARLKHVGTYSSEEERNLNGGAYIRTIHGIKFGFISYTKGTDAVTMPDGCEYAMNTLYTDYADYWSDLRYSQIRQDIQAVKDAGAEVVIALVHWGSEYGRGVTPLQEEAASLMLSNGVDVIVGTHSHMINQMEFQTVERSDGSRKKCFVAYGIGSFYTDPSEEIGCTSILLNLTFSRDKLGDITISASYIPTFINITETNGRRSFRLLDTYSSLARLTKIEEKSSQEAILYNKLLDSLDTLSNYADEDLDVGPSDEDAAAVHTALESGSISTDEIEDLQKEENAAAAAAAEAAAKESAAAAAAAAAEAEQTEDEAQPAA